MLRQIVSELKNHAPFTALGAVTGIIIMVIIVLTDVSSLVSEDVFHRLLHFFQILSGIDFNLNVNVYLIHFATTLSKILSTFTLNCTLVPSFISM